MTARAAGTIPTEQALNQSIIRVDVDKTFAVLGWEKKMER